MAISPQAQGIVDRILDQNPEVVDKLSAILGSSSDTTSQWSTWIARKAVVEAHAKQATQPPGQPAGQPTVQPTAQAASRSAPDAETTARIEQLLGTLIGNLFADPTVGPSAESLRSEELADLLKHALR